MSQQSEQLGRLRWKCRRGMLELDLVLLPFLDTCYDLLSAHQKQVFERLLEEQDPVLQSWFMHHTIPEDKELADMVEYMRAAVKGVYACNSSKKA